MDFGPDEESRAGQVLSYGSRTPADRAKAFRAAASAVSFSGVLLILIGVGLAGLILLIAAAFGGESSPTGPFGLASLSVMEWLMVAGLFGVPAGAGAAQIACGLKIRNGSVKASITAITILSFEILVLAGFGIVYLFRAPSVFNMGCCEMVIPAVALASSIQALVVLFRAIR